MGIEQDIDQLQKRNLMMKRGTQEATIQKSTKKKNRNWLQRAAKRFMGMFKK
jgi:hypothetical protein